MLLILAMNFKPCADEIILDNVDHIEIVIKKANDHTHNEKDDCSPFCYCACCSVRSYSEKELVTTLFLPQIIVQKPSFLSGHPHQVSLPIWQPPQLV